VSTTISYSTLSPAAVVAHILREYKLGELTSCEFLARGLNDTFRVQASDRSYAFRVYRAGWRSESEIQYELDVLLHLDRKGIPVSIPIAGKDGSLLHRILQPEGPRYAVLFTYAEGEQPGALSETHARLFGTATAELHAASDGFLTHHERFGLDLDHLVDQPLSAALPFLAHRPDDQLYLRELATRICHRIEAVQAELNFGFCHGDLHSINAAFDGEKVTMFDFDCCGFGWRSYDIAVYRWLLEMRNLASNWQPFLEAYQERRPLNPIDLSAVPLFVTARYIWILGLHTSNASFLGRSFLNDQLYWNYWLKLIRDWDEKELKG
jgi:Ser/Thr protein kinase RdoA (MazF antagonist)